MKKYSEEDVLFLMTTIIGCCNNLMAEELAEKWFEDAHAKAVSRAYGNAVKIINSAYKGWKESLSKKTISESEDALLTAARRAIPALAHAAERNPIYQRDYEELSAAIESAVGPSGRNRTCI